MLMYFLCSLAGDDYGIIKNLPRGLQYRFYTIGLLVGLIAVISLTSYALLFSHLTELGPGIFVLTLFLTWMLANMYILVIFTLLDKVNLPKQPLNHMPFLILIAVSLLKMEILPVKSLLGLLLELQEELKLVLITLRYII